MREKENFYLGEEAYIGSSYDSANATFEISKWQANTATLDIINVKGDMTYEAGANVTGVTSGTTYVINDVNDSGNFIEHDQRDNEEIQTEANTWMNFSETDPFGVP